MLNRFLVNGQKLLLSSVIEIYWESNKVKLSTYSIVQFISQHTIRDQMLWHTWKKIKISTVYVHILLHIITDVSQYLKRFPAFQYDSVALS